MNSHSTYDKFGDDLEAYKLALRRLNAMPDDMSREGAIHLEDAYSEARERVYYSPSLTVSDLRAKMEIIWSDIASTPRPETILAILKDLQSLTAQEPSRTFDAAQWLAWFEKLGGAWIECEGEITLLVPDQEKRPFSNRRHDARTQCLRWTPRCLAAHSRAARPSCVAQTNPTPAGMRGFDPSPFLSVFYGPPSEEEAFGARAQPEDGEPEGCALARP